MTKTCRRILLHALPAVAIMAALAFVLHRNLPEGEPLPSQDVLQPDLAFRQYDFLTSVFNTDCRIVLYGNRPQTHQAYRRCSEMLFGLHNALNAFDVKSELSKLNQASAGTAVEVSEEFWRILLIARDAYQETDGVFDVTIGPLMHFWRTVAESPERPEFQGEALERSLAAVKEHVGFGLLTLDEEKHTVTKQRTGIQVDFGGLAKGYALDRLQEILKEEGVEYYYLSLGGNTCQKLPPDHPYRNRCVLADMRPKHLGQDLCTLDGMDGQCLGTSSNSLRPISTYSDSPLGHILDPASGHVSQGTYASVTAICTSGWRSDAYSTAVFVGGEPLAQKLLQEKKATAFVFVNAADDDAQTAKPIILGEATILP